jgi:hypothetical protein
METIGTRELIKLLDGIYKDTLMVYLSNYKFNKFRATPDIGINSRYFLNRDFLNLLYTTLFNKNKIKAADNLEKHFKDFNIEALPWEEFIKC